MKRDANNFRYLRKARFPGPDEPKQAIAAGSGRAYSASWANGSPDGRITIDKLVADGDTVVVGFTGRGTHTGTLETSMGAIEPTGRSVTIKLCDVVELSDGKVTMQRSYFDTGSMMAQLGLVPDVATTTQQ